MAASMAAYAAQVYRAALKIAEACNDEKAGHDYCDRGEHMGPAEGIVCAGVLVKSEWPYEIYQYADGSEVTISDYSARVSRRARK